MGYVDDNLSIFVQPSAFEKTEGTWTAAYASQVLSEARGAAGAGGTLIIPLALESGPGLREGARIKSVDVLYKVATADLTSVATVEIAQMVTPANGTAPTAAVVASTCDSNNDTTAKRITQAAHTLTVTPTADLWVVPGSSLWLAIAYVAAATSVLTIYGARINYELRI
jgi:hypothetical protein